MVLVYGKKNILDNLINMKDNILMIKNVVKELLLGRMETLIKDNFLTISETVMVKWYGMMDRFIEEIGKKEYKMERVKLYSKGNLQKKVYLKIMY